MQTPGTLWIVATPIGNLADITARAVEVLSSVDVVAAEDTRHSKRLLQHLGISKPLIACHEHNEADVGEQIVKRLLQGEDIALISDAGTPLISDPGYRLVRMAGDQGIKVSPVPGPSSVITALSVAGLATDRFVFEGFLPAKTNARRQRLQQLLPEKRTLVVLESNHRLLACLQDLVAIFGDDREATLCRELTKTFETVKRAPLSELLTWVTDDAQQQKGEVVLVISGAADAEAALSPEMHSLFLELCKLVPASQASRLMAKASGVSRKQLYELARRRS